MNNAFMIFPQLSLSTFLN